MRSDHSWSSRQALVGEAEQPADHLRRERRAEVARRRRPGRPWPATPSSSSVTTARGRGPPTRLTARGVNRRETRLRRSVVLGVVEADDRRVGRDVGSVAALVLVGAGEDVLALLRSRRRRRSARRPRARWWRPSRRRVLPHPRVGGVRVVDVEVPVEEVDLPVGPHAATNPSGRGGRGGRRCRRRPGG